MYANGFRPNTPPPKRFNIPNTSEMKESTKKDSAEQTRSAEPAELTQPADHGEHPEQIEQEPHVESTEQTKVSELAGRAEGKKPVEMSRRSSARGGDSEWQPLIPKPDIRENAKVERLPDPTSANEPAAEAENFMDGGRAAPARITVGLLSLAGWTAILLVLLWLFSLSSPFLRDALKLQGWRSWASLAMGLLPFVGVACLTIYVMILFQKMPKVEQIKKTASTTDARLKETLKTRYLVKIADVDKYVKDNGFDSGENEGRGKLVSDCIKRLRGEKDGYYSDSTVWLMEFKNLLSFQDKLADEIIGRTWKQVGLLTAASPWKLGDRLVVAYHSAIMIARISRLYYRQVSGLVAFRLACQWIIDIYVAGELGELAANTIPSIASSFPLLGSLLGKAAEGGVNSVLVTALGRRAKLYFRPLC